MTKTSLIALFLTCATLSCLSEAALCQNRGSEPPQYVVPWPQTPADSNTVKQQVDEFLKKWKADKNDPDARYDLARYLGPAARHLAQEYGLDSGLHFLEEVQHRIGDNALMSSIVDFSFSYLLIRSSTGMEDLILARDHVYAGLEKAPRLQEVAFYNLSHIYARAAFLQRGPAFSVRERAMFWLAIDYCQNALSASSPSDDKIINTLSLSDKNYLQLIEIYTKEMPSRHEIELLGFQVGDTFKFDYKPYEWVGETTIVRVMQQ